MNLMTEQVVDPPKEHRLVLSRIAARTKAEIRTQMEGYCPPAPRGWDMLLPGANADKAHWTQQNGAKPQLDNCASQAFCWSVTKTAISHLLSNTTRIKYLTSAKIKTSKGTMGHQKNQQVGVLKNLLQGVQHDRGMESDWAHMQVHGDRKNKLCCYVQGN